MLQNTAVTGASTADLGLVLVEIRLDVEVGSHSLLEQLQHRPDRTPGGGHLAALDLHDVVLVGHSFGAAVAVMSTIPGYLIYYAVQPLPAALVHKQMLYSTIAMLLLGMLLAWLNPGRRTL